VIAIARSEGFEVVALSFRYGQRHGEEIVAAQSIAKRAGVSRHVIVDVDLRVFGASALTSDLAVPKGRSASEISQGIPITYVPARNTIFLSYALALAEVSNSSDIFLGVNALDYSGYPDCRPEYIQAFEQMANLATRAGVEGRHLTIHAPLMQQTKGEIIARGRTLGVDYALTLSCYDPDASGAACGECDACQLRLKGFAEAGVPDPARYRERVGVK
jgi:7-cyano-7-deazaguanine synthase